jgi:DNA invertase Pin-like site-specific DNA recombinase
LKQRQYVAYYRVSSPQQGSSGLSLEGQREAVRRFVDEERGKLVAEFSEVRSGLKSAGMQLREALRTCRMRRAILTVASIDRLSRRLALITAVMDSDIELAVVDSPDASRVVLHIKGAWAEHESERLSERIKAALAEAKKQGVKLGGRRPIEDMRAMARLGHRAWKERALARAMEIAPLVWKLRAAGRTLAEIATELNWRNVPTPQGRRWYSSGILRLLRKTESEFPTLAASAAARPNHRVARARERAERIIPLVWQIALTAKSLREVAKELNRLGVPTPRGRKWCREKVRNVLARGRAVLKRRVQAAAAEIAEPRRTNDKSWAIAAAPIVWRLKVNGLSRRKIAAELQRRNVPTARGGRWHHDGVKTVLELSKSVSSEADDRIAA